MATADHRPPATDDREGELQNATPQQGEAGIKSDTHLRPSSSPFPISALPSRAQDPPHPAGRTGLLAGFGYAFAGLAYSFRTQRNFRIHIAIGLIVTLAGIVLGLSWVEWAVGAILIIVVLAAEMVNTMVEALVDLVTEQYHPLAKVA